MKKLITAALALFLTVGFSVAEAPCPEDNIGSLTAWAILELEDWNQGEHSSDPSGDGHGPGTADEARSGLANIVETGNLSATLGLLVFLLEPDCDH